MAGRTFANLRSLRTEFEGKRLRGLATREILRLGIRCNQGVAVNSCVGGAFGGKLDCRGGGERSNLTGHVRLGLCMRPGAGDG